jgi:hypothetical protein
VPALVSPAPACRRRRGDRTAPHMSIDMDKFHPGSGSAWSFHSSRSPAASLKFTNAQRRAHGMVLVSTSDRIK